MCTERFYSNPPINADEDFEQETPTDVNAAPNPEEPEEGSNDGDCTCNEDDGDCADCACEECDCDDDDYACDCTLCR